MTPRSALSKREKKERGLCSDCTRPVEPGRTRCSVHLAISREKYHEHEARKRRGLPSLRARSVRLSPEGLAVRFLDRYRTFLKRHWDRKCSPIKFTLDSDPILSPHSVFSTRAEDPAALQAYWLIHYAWADPKTDAEIEVAQRLASL